MLWGALLSREQFAEFFLKKISEILQDNVSVDVDAEDNVDESDSHCCYFLHLQRV